MEKHWVFYDGDCGMCSRYAERLRRKDVNNVLQIVAFQDAPYPPMTEELREKCERAIHVITSEGLVFGGAKAVMFIKSQTGWGWFANLLSYPPFIWVIHILYRIVANNRYIFSKWFYRK